MQTGANVILLPTFPELKVVDGNCFITNQGDEVVVAAIELEFYKSRINRSWILCDILKESPTSFVNL